MTTALLNYGPMQRPQAKRNAETTSDVRGEIMAAFAQWLPIADEARNIFSIRDLTISEDKADTLYEEAVQLLNAGTAIGHVETGLESLVDAMTKKHDSSGLFVSAMHNLSLQKRLEGNFRTPIIGYRIVPGKELVLQRDSFVSSVGDFGQGRILNYSKIEDDGAVGVYANLGYRALDGVYANFYLAPDMGKEASGGIFINFNEADSLGVSAHKGVFLNDGFTRLMGYDASESLYVNKGEKPGHMSVASFLTVSLQLWNKTVLRITDAYGYDLQVNLSDDTLRVSRGWDRNVNLLQLEWAKRAVQPKIGEMERIVSEITRALDSRLSQEDVVKAAEAYDWKTAQDRLSKLGREIDEAVT